MDKPLYRYDTHLPKPVLFYATAKRKEIIHYNGVMDDPGYYLVKNLPSEFSGQVIDSVMVRADSILMVVNIE